MPSWEWWSAARCAVFFDVPVRTFRERIAVTPDFPDCFRLGGATMPRWRSDEVLAWSERESARQRRPERRAA